MSDDRRGAVVSDQTPPQIVVWACPTCGYWRQEKSTGVHQTTDPDNPRGALVRHALVPCAYIYLAEFDPDA